MGGQKKTHEIDLDYNPYEGRDEREKLDMVVTKNIVDVLMLPRFVRPRYALLRRQSKQKRNPCELSQGFLL